MMPTPTQITPFGTFKEISESLQIFADVSDALSVLEHLHDELKPKISKKHNKIFSSLIYRLNQSRLGKESTPIKDLLVYFK